MASPTRGEANVHACGFSCVFAVTSATRSVASAPPRLWPHTTDGDEAVEDARLHGAEEIGHLDRAHQRVAGGHVLDRRRIDLAGSADELLVGGLDEGPPGDRG